MHSFIYFVPVLAALTSAAPTNPLEPRQASQCGAETTLASGAYTLAANLWGESYGAGSQCSQINGLTSGSLAWQTTWSWANNPNNVKAYTNVQSSSTYCTQISSISSIPTTWSWSYSGDSVRANVAYDTFVGSSCSGHEDYEVMVWLADLGSEVYPLSNSGYPPTPTASPYIGETQFNFIIGTIGTTTVYSFVAVSEATDYSGDILDFYHYLETNQGLPSSDYVQRIQAGTEVLTGSDAELQTYGYSIGQS